MAAIRFGGRRGFEGTPGFCGANEHDAEVPEQLVQMTPIDTQLDGRMAHDELVALQSSENVSALELAPSFG